MVKLFLKLNIRKMIACGLEFLQVIINVASVNATELHPFAAISGLQKFALAWNSVLISFAHLPTCQSNIYFCSSCLDCLLMRYMTGSVRDLNKQLLQQITDDNTWLVPS